MLSTTVRYTKQDKLKNGGLAASESLISRDFFLVRGIFVKIVSIWTILYTNLARLY